MPSCNIDGGGAETTLDAREHRRSTKRTWSTARGRRPVIGIAALRFRGDEGAGERWVSWFKEYREILEADVIHLRRPDARDWDGLLHVDPDLDRRGLAVLYNPLLTPGAGGGGDAC